MSIDLVAMRDEVDRALASADPELYRQVATARVSRPVSTSQPTVVVHPDDVDEPVDGLTPAPGTVTLYWAPRRSTLLRQFEGAMATGDFSLVADRYREIARRHAGRTITSVKAAVQSMLEAPSFFDLRYGRRTLAANLWIDETAELASLTLPFAGGDLDPGQFEIAECVSPDTVNPSPTNSLVVVRHPRLSDIERRLLHSIPAAEREMQIGASETVMATPTALATIAIWVTINTAVTTCCGTFRDRLAEVSLPANVLREAGGSGSVAELLRLRAEIFDAYGIR